MRFAVAVLLCLLPAVTVEADDVVDRSQPLEVIEADYELADGPAWDGSALFVPDVKGQTLYRYFPGAKKRAVVGRDIGRLSASCFNHGNLYVSDNGNARIGIAKGGRIETLVQLDAESKPPQRPNDLVVDHDGGVYFTLTGPGKVMYLSPERDLSVAVEKIATPNGIALSPDEKTLYVSAYVPKKIWAYELPSPGQSANGRILGVMDDGEAKGADGMTVDRAGNVYCAGATDVWIWSPGGKLLDRIECPTRPINCAFGDSDMQSLYITSFGGLYRQRMKVTGRSPHPPARPQAPNSNRQTRPSTAMGDELRADLDVVYAEYANSDRLGDTRRVLMDVFRRRDLKGPGPAVLVVHGGGWLKGDKTKFRALTLELARRGYVTAAIEYRLGGEALFPAAIHDCSAAVRFLRAHAQEYQVDPERIGAVGGSAGGHLVGLMAAGAGNPRLAGDGGWPDRSSRIQAAIVMAGPLQMVTGSVAERSRTSGSKSNSNRWLGKTVDEAPELYRLADAYEQIDSECCPILFMCGEHDNPERNEPARIKLKEAGVETGLKVYPDGKHGCWNQLPWFNDMVEDMDTYFSKHLKE